MSTPSQHSSYRYVIEVTLFLTYMVFGLSWIAVTPLIGEIMSEFRITATEFGLLNTLVSVAKIFAPLLTGVLAVRIGLKRTILLGSLLISCAVLAPFATDFKLFLVSRFVFGIGGAMVVTLLSPVVMQWFPREELPLVNAFNNVAVNTGIALTLFITVPIAGALGWRNTLLVYAFVSVALMITWALLGREHASATAGGGAAKSTEGGARYADVWRMRETWLVALCFSGPLALYLAFNTWLPKYYMEAFGYSKATASQYTGLFNLIGIPSAIAGGILTRKLGVRRPFIILAGVLVGTASVGMYAINSPPVIWASAVCLGIGLFIAASPLITTAMELPGMTPQKVSLVMGTMFSFAYVISSVSPIAVGFLKDTTGTIIPGFVVWSAYAWVVVLCGVLLPETGPSGVKKAGEGSSVSSPVPLRR